MAHIKLDRKAATMTVKLAVLITAAGLTFASAALAQNTSDSYCATISEHDKVASDGFELSDAGSILRQDRANFHKFGDADGADQGDDTFASANARARIPAMLDSGGTDPRVLREIVRGTPHVCVDIYRNYIEVYLD